MRSILLAILAIVILALLAGCGNAVMGTLPGGPKIALPLPDSTTKTRLSPELEESLQNPIYGTGGDLDHQKTLWDKAWPYCVFKRSSVMGDERDFLFSVSYPPKKLGEVEGVEVNSPGGTRLAYIQIKNWEVTGVLWIGRVSKEKVRGFIFELQEKLPEVRRVGWTSPLSLPPWIMKMASVSPVPVYASASPPLALSASPASSSDSSPLSSELEATIERPPFGTVDNGWESAVQGFKACCQEPQAVEAPAARIFTVAVDAAGVRHGVQVADSQNQVELILGVENDKVSAVFWRKAGLPIPTVRRIVRDVQNYLALSSE